MNENTNAGNGANNNGGNGGGTNPPVNQNNGGDNNQNANAGGQNNQNNQNTPTFDPAKISDADFEKVFSDERLFKHSRFKELAEDAKAGKAARDAEAKRQQEEAIKKGEFDKVLGEKDKTIQTLTERVQTITTNNAITLAASKLGAVDPDAVLALVDRSKISIDEKTGVVTGVEEALKSLFEAKPYLAGKQGTQRLGSPSNPNQQNTGDLKRFKHSEIQDPVFYREHEAEILASMKAGLIENDV